MLEWVPLTEYLRLPASPGIYVIRHRETGKEYVGQSTNIRKRMGTHKRASKRHYLGRAIALHGATAFEVAVVLLCAAEVLGAEEQRVIEERGTFHPGGYNLSLGGLGPTGAVWTEAQRAAVSARTKGVPLLPETKEKMRQAALINNPFKGKNHTPEALAKIGAATVRVHTGLKRSDEARKNISASLVGRKAPHIPPEARERIANKLRGTKDPRKSQPGEKNGMYGKVGPLAGKKGGAHPTAKAVLVWPAEAFVPIRFESLVEVAEWLGVGNRTVSTWCLGQRVPKNGMGFCYA